MSLRLPRSVLLLVLGSAVVHFALVACGSGDATGEGMLFAAGDCDCPGAAAPEVVTVACTEFVDENGVSYSYAEHTFTGRTAEELSRVVALGHLETADVYGVPSGFQSSTIAVAVMGGRVAVPCFQPNPRLSSVTFTLP